MSNSAERAALALARANIYRFFAGVFLAPPTEEFLRHARAPEFRTAFADWMDQSVWEEIDAAWLDDLVVEYNRRFVVPGASYVPTYESVYTDQIDIEYSPHMISGAGEMPTRVGKLLWGPSTVAVARAYAAVGFAVTRDTGEPPDHLGIELQFLARLCNGQAAAWLVDDVPTGARLQDLEQAFLQEHPLRWITQFRERVDASGAHSFYRAFARLGESFLQSTQDTFESLHAKPSR